MKPKLFRVKYAGHWCRYFNSRPQAEKFAKRVGGEFQKHNPFALPGYIERDEFGDWVTV